MKKDVGRDRFRAILLTIGAFLVVLVVFLPLYLAIFNGTNYGNVARIPITGVITTTGGNYLGTSTISSKTITNFIKEAEENKAIKAIVIEINSPGGTPVATDEISEAIKKTNKPTVALIREVGASAGYWIATSTDHIVANRMSITGSIGVFSSYLEFSGLMEEYGVGYERINAGEYKDLGVPYRKLEDKEKQVLQSRIDKLHMFFIDTVAENRGLEKSKVRELATGEIFLGVEALENGLVDELGNADTVEDHLKNLLELEEVKYSVYQRKVTFMDLFTGSFGNFATKMGEGLGFSLLRQDNNLIMI